MTAARSSRRALTPNRSVLKFLKRLRAIEGVEDAGELDLQEVLALERALGHALSDDILALCAAGLTLFEERFDIGLDRVIGHTEAARGHGCENDIFAFGVQSHDGIFLCSPSTNGKVPTLVFFDAEDGSTDSVPLVGWLETLLEGLEEDGEEGATEDGETKPVAAASTFSPCVVARAPAAVLGRVRHAVFGEGDIVREIADGTPKVEVNFASVGRKVLLASALQRLV